ncbi:MAG: tyrosine-type recombinase/integrase [Anaerolineae bacterium]|nr:tyrosine-type recombinase/integrase [Thermoflexales bacterium]MDW8407627.1 tyrosine-type recombinase/integrase [Anaerolineae bacterium]
MHWQSGIEEFLGHLRSDRNASPNTIWAYKNDLNQLVDYLAARQPAPSSWDEITEDILAAYVGTLAERGYTTSTIARKIAALKTLFHWLNQRGHIQRDPSLKLKSPRVQKRVPRLLTPEEVERLFEAASAGALPRSARDRALLEVIYSTGMRVSEAINLRLGDLSLETNEIRCAGRGDRYRLAPLLPRAAAALRQYLAHARLELAGNVNTDYVFLNPQGAKLTRQAVWLMTRQCAKAAQLEGDVTPHTLRHSRAAHLLSSGEDVRRVQEWLGHANLATTQMYRSRLSGTFRPAQLTESAVNPAGQSEAPSAEMTSLAPVSVPLSVSSSASAHQSASAQPEYDSLPQSSTTDQR